MQHAPTLWRDEVARPGSGSFAIYPLSPEEAAKLAVERALALYTEICEAVPWPPLEMPVVDLVAPHMGTVPTPKPHAEPGGRVAYFAKCVCGGRTTVSVDALDAPPKEFATSGILFCGRCGNSIRVTGAGASPTTEG